MGTHRPRRVPHFEAQVEDGQGDRREKDGRTPLIEAERDGGMQLHPPTAAGLRYLQELRGHVTCRFHGRQWCGDAWARKCLRTKRGNWRWRQEEVMDCVPTPSMCHCTRQSALQVMYSRWQFAVGTKLGLSRSP